MQWPYDITLGVQDVLTERHRQVDVEAFDSKHDDDHPHGNLTQAAMCYAYASVFDASFLQRFIRTYWPWSERWWKPKGRRRNLVKAAALIIAEIERLDRNPGDNTR